MPVCHARLGDPGRGRYRLVLFRVTYPLVIRTTGTGTSMPNLNGSVADSLFVLWLQFVVGQQFYR
jgi:hypothetical protein